MEEFLSSSFNRFNSNDYTDLTIVMGNESCDLDSAISSIVYATFLNWKNGESTEKELFIPFLDVEREDFPLKTEVEFCLNMYNIFETYLLFKNEIDFKNFMKIKNIKIILVDHHILSTQYDFLLPFVKEIIDHRPLDRKKWSYNDDLLYKIDIVGSCCTLIGQKIKDNNGNFFEKYPICANLLHCAIILDTVNFSKEVNKATPLDHEIVLYLESMLKLNNFENERKSLLEKLVEARSDVSKLTAEQLLRKDLKIVNYILVPSFPILAKDFLEKSKSIESVTKVLGQRDCAIALLLGMDLNEGLKRDGVIISKEETKGEELSNFLQNWSSPALDLVFYPQINRFYFKQLNLSASRKQYMPALNEFINKLKI